MASVAATITAPILLLALRSAAVVAFFFPSFAIFVLVWGLLIFLGILAFIPMLHFWCCLSCSACLFSSSLSPKVVSLGCFSCRPPSLVVPIYVFGVSFCSSSAVSSSSPPAGGGVGSCLASLGVTAQLFLRHLQFSATCHAAGYPSGVPHLAVSGWLTYSCGGGLAWGWGCLSTDVLLPPWVSTLCQRSFPFGVLHP